LQARHDHGSQYVSDHFQEELKFLGITPSPAFVREPEGNGVAERFIRALKEQLFRVQHGRGAAGRAARIQGALQPGVALRAVRPSGAGSRAGILEPTEGGMNERRLAIELHNGARIDELGGALSH
jgi:transposase InsO family protein